jgi:hypothetical protein
MQCLPLSEPTGFAISALGSIFPAISVFSCSLQRLLSQVAQIPFHFQSTKIAGRIASPDRIGWRGTVFSIEL